MVEESGVDDEGDEKKSVSGVSSEAERVLNDRLSDGTKYLLSRRYSVIIGVLVLALFGSVYVGYAAHTSVDTVTQERVVSTWSTSTEFDHGATVERDAIVFQEGVRLRNRTLYFTSLSPVLNGTYSVRHGGSDPEPASVRAELRLVLRSVGDEGTEYWRESETLIRANDSSLEPGEELGAGFSVNVTESMRRISEIEENLSASPGGTEMIVTAETAVQGEVGGEGYVDTRSESLRIEPGEGTYSVFVETEGERREDMTETVERTLEPSFAAAYGPFVAALISLAGILSMVWGRRRGVFELPPEKVDSMRFERQRERLDEWISRGTVSGDAGETEVRLDSLEGVVDVAIDSDRRVVETDDSGFVVLVGDVRYVYEPNAEEGQSSSSSSGS